MIKIGPYTKVYFGGRNDLTPNGIGRSFLVRLNWIDENLPFCPHWSWERF